MNKDRLLSDGELAQQVETITQAMFVTLSEWQAGVAIDWQSAKVNGRAELVNLINTQKRLYAESLRSKDPHKCEFGHEVYFHKTVDGWCCACDADQAFMESEIEKKARIK